jgi:hypothetical protein
LSAAALKPVPVRVKAKLAVPAVLVAGAMLVNVAAVVVKTTGVGVVWLFVVTVTLLEPTVAGNVTVAVKDVTVAAVTFCVTVVPLNLMMLFAAMLSNPVPAKVSVKLVAPADPVEGEVLVIVGVTTKVLGPVAGPEPTWTETV